VHFAWIKWVLVFFLLFFNIIHEHEHNYVSQREYEEFKVRINALVAKAQKMPEEGWTMQDGTPWPGNNPRDHPGMIQVLPSFLHVSIIMPAFPCLYPTLYPFFHMVESRCF
jgi:hypothetical protein